MGTDKALLQLPNGQPLLHRTVQVAQQVTPTVAVVTPWPARYHTLLADTDAQLIQEPPPNPVPRQSYTALQTEQKPSAGPLSGFAYGWQHISSDWCLLLACDLPYLNAEALNQWWHHVVSTRVVSTSTERVLPVASLVASRKGWEPLCGFYHRSCLHSLTHQLSTDQFAFQPWLQKISVVRYDEASPKMFWNCNTLADWQAVTRSMSTHLAN